MALRGKDRLIARAREIVLSNLDAMDAFVRAQPGAFGWRRPRGGSVGLARLEVGEPASVFADRLVRATGIMLLPSTVFDYGDVHVRLGFGRRDFPDALAELGAYLNGSLDVERA
jgi:aspartate/methionine/tyrosine aminotransferase